MQNGADNDSVGMLTYGPDGLWRCTATDPNGLITRHTFNSTYVIHIGWLTRTIPSHNQSISTAAAQGLVGQCLDTTRACGHGVLHKDIGHDRD